MDDPRLKLVSTPGMTFLEWLDFYDYAMEHQYEGINEII